VIKLKVNIKIGGKMNKETYLNYGVYKDNTLFMALGGNFASKAWTESDEAFAQIAGTSFQACTADDGKVYNIGKYDIRRLKSDEEFEALLKQAHPAFRIFIKVEALPKTMHKDMKWCTYQNCLAAVYDSVRKDHPDEPEAEVEEALYNYYAKEYGATSEELQKEKEEFEARLAASLK
jgi:hypothetical protein